MGPVVHDRHRGDAAQRWASIVVGLAVLVVVGWMTIEAMTARPLKREADAAALYAVLEEQVLPAYYERDDTGLPQRWIALMRESIAALGPRFGTARMAAEYVERLYLPAHEGATRPTSRVA